MLAFRNDLKKEIDIPRLYRDNSVIELESLERILLRTPESF